MDAKSLYHSVPRKEVPEYVLKKGHWIKYQKQIPTEDVLKMMDTILEKNNCSLNKRIFYSDRIWVWILHPHVHVPWERNYLKSSKQPLVYFQYVDDIWGL
jgi:hypothetical protein